MKKIRQKQHKHNTASPIGLTKKPVALSLVTRHVLPSITRFARDHFGYTAHAQDL